MPPGESLQITNFVWPDVCKIHLFDTDRESASGHTDYKSAPGHTDCESESGHIVRESTSTYMHKWQI